MRIEPAGDVVLVKLDTPVRSLSDAQPGVVLAASVRPDHVLLKGAKVLFRRSECSVVDAHEGIALLPVEHILARVFAE